MGSHCKVLVLVFSSYFSFEKCMIFAVHFILLFILCVKWEQITLQNGLP